MGLTLIHKFELNNYNYVTLYFYNCRLVLVCIFFKFESLNWSAFEYEIYIVIFKRIQVMPEDEDPPASCLSFYGLGA